MIPRCLVIVFVLLSLWVPAPRATAGEPAPSASAESKKSSDKAGPAAAQFQKIFTEWKNVLAELSAIQVRYGTADDAERAELRKQWDQSISKAESMQGDFIQAAEKAYLEAPNADGQVSNFLLEMTAKGIRNDDYEETVRLAELLLKNKCDNKQLNDMAGIAAFAVSDFDSAEKYFKAAKQQGGLGKMGENYLRAIPKIKPVWEEEKKIRAAEAKADDLPRVLMKTNKGDLEIELFENETPNTVANFISLVEKKFYDGLTFHRVRPNFMAQGGDPDGNGTGGPGYSIACECYQPNYRHHFRGSLSMAHAGRDTGGSQFFLTFLPTSHLDGVHTVFGRVIKGFGVLGKLQQRDPDSQNPPQPDKIIEAKVLRKRDHEYKPKTLPGR